jgi:hypothetical protein
MLAKDSVLAVATATASFFIITYYPVGFDLSALAQVL